MTTLIHITLTIIPPPNHVQLPFVTLDIIPIIILVHYHGHQREKMRW